MLLPAVGFHPMKRSRFWSGPWALVNCVDYLSRRHDHRWCGRRKAHRGTASQHDRSDGSGVRVRLVPVRAGRRARCLRAVAANAVTELERARRNRFPRRWRARVSEPLPRPRPSRRVRSVSSRHPIGSRSSRSGASRPPTGQPDSCPTRRLSGGRLVQVRVGSRVGSGVLPGAFPRRFPRPSWSRLGGVSGEGLGALPGTVPVRVVSVGRPAREASRLASRSPPDRDGPEASRNDRRPTGADPPRVLPGAVPDRCPNGRHVMTGNGRSSIRREASRSVRPAGSWSWRSSTSTDRSAPCRPDRSVPAGWSPDRSALPDPGRRPAWSWCSSPSSGWCSGSSLWVRVRRVRKVRWSHFHPPSEGPNTRPRARTHRTLRTLRTLPTPGSATGRDRRAVLGSAVCPRGYARARLAARGCPRLRGSSGKPRCAVRGSGAVSPTVATSSARSRGRRPALWAWPSCTTGRTTAGPKRAFSSFGNVARGGTLRRAERADGTTRPASTAPRGRAQAERGRPVRGPARHGACGPARAALNPYRTLATIFVRWIRGPSWTVVT